MIMSPHRMLVMLSVLAALVSNGRLTFVTALRARALKESKHFVAAHRVVDLKAFDAYGRDHFDALMHHDENHPARRMLFGEHPDYDERTAAKLSIHLTYRKEGIRNLQNSNENETVGFDDLDNTSIGTKSGSAEYTIKCNDLSPMGQYKAISDVVAITSYDLVENPNGSTVDREYSSNTLMSSDFACVVTVTTGEDGVVRMHGVWRDPDAGIKDFVVNRCETQSDPEGTDNPGSCVILSDQNTDPFPACDLKDEIDSGFRRRLRSSDIHSHTINLDHKVEEHVLGRRRLDGAATPLPFALGRWEGCYDGMDNIHEMAIGVSVGSELVSSLGGKNFVLPYLEAIISETNVIYIQQLNVKLLIRAVEIISPAAAGTQIWDNPRCSDAIHTQLSNYLSSSRPSSQGLWHLMDDCWISGTIGSAVKGSLCYQGSNEAISWFRPSGGTWLVFAHETGHIFGASHTFEEGQGKTGGIMDYGDQLYNLIAPFHDYQFNKKYRWDDLCDLIKEQLTCQFWNIMTKSSIVSQGTCGNKKIEDGEECECANGQLVCDCCSYCEIKSTASCSPFGNECCTESCTYQPTSVTCEHSDGLGYCRNGYCAGSQCGLAGRGDFCGMDSDEKPCYKRCQYLGYCSAMPNIYYMDRNLRFVRDGAYCETSTVGYGQCQNGECLAVIEESIVTTKPSPATSTPVPTRYPTIAPTKFPTGFPTLTTTNFPTTIAPTQFPIAPAATEFPTQYPTLFPTYSPTRTPTSHPTLFPTTGEPTSQPTEFPTEYPTGYPTPYPLGDFVIDDTSKNCCSELQGLYGLEYFKYRSSIVDGVVCGATTWPGKPCGYGSASAAQQICQAFGARVCTLDEIQAQAIKSTGCNVDSELVWSSTSCTTVGGFPGYMAANGIGQDKTCFESGAELLVSCCGDSICNS